MFLMPKRHGKFAIISKKSNGTSFEKGSVNLIEKLNLKK